MAKQKAAEQSADYYLDRIEELTHKLNQSENKLKAMEEQHTDEQKKVSYQYDPCNQDVMAQWWFDVGPPSVLLANNQLFLNITQKSLIVNK